MGTQSIGAQKLARYRKKTSLDIVAAFVDAGSHARVLCLANGKMAEVDARGEKLTFLDERWDSNPVWRNTVAAYRERFAK